MIQHMLIVMLVLVPHCANAWDITTPGNERTFIPKHPAIVCDKLEQARLVASVAENARTLMDVVRKVNREIGREDCEVYDGVVQRVRTIEVHDSYQRRVGIFLAEIPLERRRYLIVVKLAPSA